MKFFKSQIQFQMYFSFEFKNGFVRLIITCTPLQFALIALLLHVVVSIDNTKQQDRIYDIWEGRAKYLALEMTSRQRF